LSSDVEAWGRKRWIASKISCQLFRAHEVKSQRAKTFKKITEICPFCHASFVIQAADVAGAASFGVQTATPRLLKL
jgi:hypothetical protein